MKDTGILRVEYITPPIKDISILKAIARQVKRDAIRMIYEARSGHPGGALGCAEFLTTLFFAVMKHNPPHFDPDGRNTDVFILSNGHICAAFYSVLARCGYFPISELKTFRKINSRLQGHPSPCTGLPGVYIATGSLGQGLSVGIGAALAKKLNNDPSLVYVLISDGELQEGQTWEAIAFAGHYRVDNIIVTVDWNNKQIDGNVEEVMSLGDLPARWRALRWEVLHIEKGNDVKEVLNTLEAALQLKGQGKPVVILMKTIMGHGVDFMENDYRWHGVPPNDDEYAKALSQLPPVMVDF